MKGERIGSYRVERLVGQGGMGAVYEAVHEQLGRKAAIKLLRRELSQDPQIAMRFFREAQAANRVEHSGIVAIYEFGHLPDGTAYIIMEFLRGEALSARLRSRGGRLPYHEAVRIGRQIASALAAAHARAVIHRDLKPDNVMLVPDSEMPGGERVKILDFGVAKVDTEVVGPAAEDFKTDTGIVLGTASYMAPEQCKGAGNVTDKADVYSLGVVMYRLLCGQLPFRAEGQGEVMAMHIFSTPKPLRDHDPNIPTVLTSLVERMMSKDPNERPSMTQVATELERAAATLTPGPLPVVVIGGQGPLTTGQTPTAAPLSAGQSGDARDRAASGTADAVPPAGGRTGLWLTLLFLVSLTGGGAAAYHYGLVKLPQQPVTPPPPPPSVLVRWTLSSAPAGAEVINKADGTPLGVTPWFREQPMAQGKRTLILRAAGYQDVELVFDEAQSTSRHEAMVPGTTPRTDLGAAAPMATPDLGGVPPTIPGPDLGTKIRPAGPTVPGSTPNGPRLPIRKRPNTPSGGTLNDDDIDIGALKD